MACFQEGGVDKTDAGTPAAPEFPGVQKQREQGETHQFYKSVVTNRCREIVVYLSTDIPLIIPLETLAA
jgi:hypothetical protein